MPRHYRRGLTGSASQNLGLGLGALAGKFVGRELGFDDEYNRQKGYDRRTALYEKESKRKAAAASAAITQQKMQEKIAKADRQDAIELKAFDGILGFANKKWTKRNIYNYNERMDYFKSSADRKVFKPREGGVPNPHAEALRALSGPDVTKEQSEEIGGEIYKLMKLTSGFGTVTPASSTISPLKDAIIGKIDEINVLAVNAGIRKGIMPLLSDVLATIGEKDNIIFKQVQAEKKEAQREKTIKQATETAKVLKEAIAAGGKNSQAAQNALLSLRMKYKKAGLPDDVLKAFDTSIVSASGFPVAAKPATFAERKYREETGTRAAASMEKIRKQIQDLLKEKDNEKTTTERFKEIDIEIKRLKSRLPKEEQEIDTTSTLESRMDKYLK